MGRGRSLLKSTELRWSREFFIDFLTIHRLLIENQERNPVHQRVLATSVFLLYVFFLCFKFLTNIGDNKVTCLKLTNVIQ